MISREQFEKWVLSKSNNSVIDTILDKDKYGKYFHGSVEGSWQAWQASRECIEVELPTPDYYSCLALSPDDVVQALKVQGIKVKD